MKLLHVKSRRDFLRIQNSPEGKDSCEHFLLLYRKTSDKHVEDTSRIGIVVTKKIDKRAVIRNHIKRQIREICGDLFKNSNELFLKNYDYEIIAKRNILGCKFIDLKQNFIKILTKLLEQNGRNSYN
ncbi:MAG: ribonuclease P protein component [Rickettsiales bacterium]|nr:ribonuclease P protein component [Rickettsiales bacterium]